MLLILSIIISSLIYGLIIKTGILFLLVKEMRKAHWKEWKNVLLAYLQRRSERNLLITFMTVEAGLAGVVPQLAKMVLVLKTKDAELGVSATWFCNNSDIVSLTIALIIAFAYFIYVWMSYKKQPQNWDEIINAARLVNEELDFIPTQQWFERQNEKAIVSLGKRYSGNRNFPYDNMDFALASFEREDAFHSLLIKELKDFVEAVVYLSRNKEKDDKLLTICDSAENLALDIKLINGNVDSYLRIKNNLDSFVKEIDDYYYHHLNRSNGGHEYETRKLRDASYELKAALSNEWIGFKARKTLFIAGEAGCGKSHLIGDIVTKRKLKKEPSILLLGQHFTTALDPLSQVTSLLDIKCKKDHLLGQLEKYGKKQNQNVVIFIDAINEGAGFELWNAFLDEFLTSVKEFEYIRVVLSFRISDRKDWFYDLAHDNQNTVLMHQGFKGKERDASHYMFESFGLDQPLWPVYGSEFANPLFLIKYCRNHERSGKPLLLEDFWSTIVEYCQGTNHELSIKFNYNDAQNLVFDSMRAIAALMVEGGSRWELEYNDVIAKLTEVAQYTNNPKSFLELLIDEGLLRTEEYQNKHFVVYSFERLGDYFIADYLIEKKPADEWLSYKWGDLTEAISIIVPLRRGCEGVELVKEDDRGQAINGFVESSAWRDTFCPKGVSMIHRIKEQKQYDYLYDIILSRPFRSDTCADSGVLYEMLWNLTLTERDRVWTTVISNEWGNGAKLRDLALWACEASTDTVRDIDEHIAYKCAETLIWSFATTWRLLRDTSTHALTNIFRGHPSLMMPLLAKYAEINDPYIQERLWCAIYGAEMLLQNLSVASELAEWTYNNVFANKHVPENILIRDYARNIVYYAQSLGNNTVIDAALLMGPFTDGELPEIPTCEEINARYERDWSTLPENERSEYSAVSSILSSMATEHYPKRAYGDFGRYVFQSYISDFGEDEFLMANWAISMIFEEFGYNAKVFAQFDTNNTSHDRAHSAIERIGKKYQWIALYRIMALLMDRHPDIDWKEKWNNPIKSARSIDPTIYPNQKNPAINGLTCIPDFSIKKPSDNKKWLWAWKKMPKIQDYVIRKDENGIEWINLFSYSTLKFTNGDLYNSEAIDRDLWTFIQAYATERSNLKTVCSNLYKYGIQGRSFHENQEVYGVYSREYYWSSIYKQELPEEYYRKVVFEVGHKAFPETIIEPAYLQYLQESCNDASSENGFNLLMPNEWIVDGLQLHFAEENGGWMDSSNTIVAFDNSVFRNGHSTLFIRKDKLLEYLNQKNKCLFWPILCERMIHSRGHGFASHVQCGGWAYMDTEGKIHQHLRCYEHSMVEKRLNKWKETITSKTDSVLLFLHEHHLIWLPKKKRMKLYLGDDYGWFVSMHRSNSDHSLEKLLKELSNDQDTENEVEAHDL